MTDALFEGFDERLPEPPPVTAKTRRDARIAETIAAGFHPLGLQSPRPIRLLSDGDHRCGDCASRVMRRMGGTYPKCEQGPFTGGPATDVLARWPACERWIPKP